MAIAIPPPPPPGPPQLRSLSHAARVRLYGSFKWAYRPAPQAPDRIEVDAAWLTANVVILELPHLAHCNGGKAIRARVHKRVAAPMLALFNAWRSAGLLLHIQSWDGAYVARFKRGKGGGDESMLSNHAWGSAFDINARWNRLGMKPAPLGAPGCVLPLVAIANEHGFAWGGHFNSSPDGMHFECVRA